MGLRKAKLDLEGKKPTPQTCKQYGEGEHSGYTVRSQTKPHHTGSVLRSPVPLRPWRRQPSRPALPNAPRGGERLVHRGQG